jgi:uncharacterized protein YbjT (DUF2867 family)
MNRLSKLWSNHYHDLTMILITGATGQVGGQALKELVASGATVRALVRDPARAAELAGAELVPGSFEDDASLARALAGADAMLLAGRDSPDAVAQHRRVLAQARRAGVQHVVKLSAIGASPDATVALMREHHEIDEEVRDGPWSWTLLAPHLFMQNLLRAAASVRRDGRLAAPMGDERFPLVDTRDVGAAAATVLSDPGEHAGRAYRLTGPAAYGYDEIARSLAVVAGRPIAYEPVPPDVYEARLLAAGVPGWRAFDLAHIAGAYTAAEHAVSPDLATLLARAPRSLSAFLSDHAGVFAGDRG